jgi:hypothetical protein
VVAATCREYARRCGVDRAGQQLIVVPEYDMVTVFTGWDFLPSEENVRMTGLLAHSTQPTGSMAA